MIQRSLNRLVASSYGPALKVASVGTLLSGICVFPLLSVLSRSAPAPQRAISGSYRRGRDAILISVFVYELEPLWTFSGLPTPRFSFVMALMFNS